MKKWISPYYFGTQVIAGVQRFVRKMTATSALEVVPQEDLDALQQGAVKRAEEHIRKAAAAGEPEETIWAPTDISTAKPVAQDAGDYQIGDADRLFKPQMSPLQAALQRYSQALAAGDSEGCRDATAEILKWKGR